MKTASYKYRVALWLVLSAVLPAALLLSPVGAAFAKPTPIPTKMADITIGIQTANPVVQPGDAFDLQIIINSDTPSRGAQTEISFDPKLVQVTGVSEGDYYKKWAQANKGNTLLQPSKPQIDNEKGHVALVAVAVLGGTVGQGPTGTGTLLIVHAKAQPGASGAATFKLDNLIVADVGDASGTSQSLGGVKVQNGVVTVGAGQAVATPTVEAVTAVPTAVQPTIAPRAQAADPAAGSDSSSGGLGGPLLVVLIAVPVVAAILIGGGVLVMLSRRK